MMRESGFGAGPECLCRNTSQHEPESLWTIFRVLPRDGIADERRRAFRKTPVSFETLLYRDIIPTVLWEIAAKRAAAGPRSRCHFGTSVF